MESWLICSVQCEKYWKKINKRTEQPIESREREKQRWFHHEFTSKNCDVSVTSPFVRTHILLSDGINWKSRWHSGTMYFYKSTRMCAVVLLLLAAIFFTTSSYFYGSTESYTCIEYRYNKPKKKSRGKNKAKEADWTHNKYNNITEMKTTLYGQNENWNIPANRARKIERGRHV